MKPADFRYFCPDSVAEALRLLAEHGDGARVIAGGQSLMPLLNMRLARPALLVDLNRIPELAGIRREGDWLVLGAMTRQGHAERSPLVRECSPLLAEALAHVGHLATRARGTIGGSLVHADPAAELPAVACALGAELEVIGPDGVRTLAPDQFFVTYFTTALRPGELLTTVRLPMLPPRTGQAFREVSRRHSDFALAGAAVQVTLAENGQIAQAAVGLTGVGATPRRAVAAEEMLAGQLPGADLYSAAAAVAAQESEPESDLHASADYRRHLAAVMTQEALALAVSRAEGRGYAWERCGNSG